MNKRKVLSYLLTFIMVLSVLSPVNVSSAAIAQTANNNGESTRQETETSENELQELTEAS